MYLQEYLKVALETQERLNGNLIFHVIFRIIFFFFLEFSIQTLPFNVLSPPA